LHWTTPLSKTFFLSLKLDDSAGRLVSDNFYWLSTAPEIPGAQGTRDRAFFIDTKSHPDYTALEKLPPARVKHSARFQQDGRETVAHVTVENAGNTLAFLVHLVVRKGPQGDEVAPCYWSDNYLALLPGERRTLTVRFATEDLAGAAPAVRVGVWGGGESTA
jgi:exo-1,4-beta-D-glucosaminidase